MRLYVLIGLKVALMRIRNFEIRNKTIVLGLVASYLAGALFVVTQAVLTVWPIFLRAF